MKMKPLIPTILIVLLLASAPHAQQTVAIPVPATTLTATVTPDPKLAALEARLATCEKTIAAQQQVINKIRALQVIPADAAAVPLETLLK